MNCTKIQEMLPRYQDRDLPPGEQMQIRVHMATCPDCQEALAEYGRMLDACRDAVGAYEPRNRFDELRDRIRVQEARPNLFGGPGRVVAVVVAAACIGVIAAFVVTPCIEMGMALNRMADSALHYNTEAIEGSVEEIKSGAVTADTMLAWSQKIDLHNPLGQVHGETSAQPEPPTEDTVGEDALKPLSREIPGTPAISANARHDA